MLAPETDRQTARPRKSISNPLPIRSLRSLLRNLWGCVCQQEPLLYWQAPVVHTKATRPPLPLPASLNSMALPVHRIPLPCPTSIPGLFPLVSLLSLLLRETALGLASLHLSSLPQRSSHGCFGFSQRPLAILFLLSKINLPIHRPVRLVASLCPCLHCPSIIIFLLEMGVNLCSKFSITPISEISSMTKIFRLKKRRRIKKKMSPSSG